MNSQNCWWLTIVSGLLLASPVQAASLTLGCSGTLTTMHVSQVGVASDTGKENIVDFSVVIDFDQRTVSGFGGGGPLPITAVDVNSVTFAGSQKGAAVDQHIGGSVDRITGKIDATERQYFATLDDAREILEWDLRCRPTRRLF
jgi:hypothetical protein